MTHIDLHLMRMLLVDDNKHFLSICFEALRAYGVRKIEKTTDPVAGLEMLQREWFDVAIVDMNMPIIDGAMFTRLVRSDTSLPNTNIAIVMLTAYHEKGVVEQALRAGVSGFVVKPFRPTDLVKRLHAAIANPLPRPNGHARVFEGNEPDREKLDAEKARRDLRDEAGPPCAPDDVDADRVYL